MSDVSAPSPILSVEGLRVDLGGGAFGGERKTIVDQISLAVAPGEVLALVGESGSGKSTILRSVARLVRPTAGKVSIAGKDVWRLSSGELRSWRRKFQMVFQDPYASLDPRMTVSGIVGEPLSVHEQNLGRAERDRRITEVLEEVGMDAGSLNRYPHEFSGGQRQRIAIARALIVRPEILLLDEPVSALDVSVRAQVLNLLLDLREKYGLAYLFVSHDLAVVRLIADSVVVLERGRIVERGPAVRVIEAPEHPTTKALRASLPG
jgi:peptide/nickel transport system ATP-binding protein